MTQRLWDLHIGEIISVSYNWRTILTPNLTDTAGDGAARQYRLIIPAGSSYSGTKVRITLKGYNENWSIEGTSIGESTANDDFDAAPTRITWDTGSSSTTIISTPGNDGTKVSDEITFTFDKTKRYLIHLLTAARHTYCSTDTSNTEYYLESNSPDNTLTTAVSYTIWDGYYGLSKVEVWSSE